MKNIKILAGIQRLAAMIAVLLLILFSAFPYPVSADGGPITASDTELYTNLKEGDQVAVVHILPNEATIDLFVSILDQTGVSHDITYFVPLGADASGFSVSQQNASDFNDIETRGLDEELIQKYQDNREYISTLFAGTLITNGVWLTPLWLPVLLSGCDNTPQAVSTFKTDSSVVSVFNIDANTDLQALEDVTGLAPSETQTLSSLTGQQIAVLQIHTTPQEASSGAKSGTSTETGLHLYWTTATTSTTSGTVYTYPLGTGAAWANPIDMTRVYVVSPANINFTVSYPKLGVNRSGYIQKGNSYQLRIEDSLDTKAYAVDDVVTPKYSIYGPLESVQPTRIWRVTYTNSNAAQNIVVNIGGTAKASFFTNLADNIRHSGVDAAFITGLIVAIIFWELAWLFLMPRLLGKDRKNRHIGRFSMTYVGWNLVACIPGVIPLAAFEMGYPVPAIILMLVFFIPASVLVFAFRHLRKLGVEKKTAIKAFAITILVSNGAYLLFALGYARLAGAI